MHVGYGFDRILWRKSFAFQVHHAENAATCKVFIVTERIYDDVFFKIIHNYYTFNIFLRKDSGKAAKLKASKSSLFLNAFTFTLFFMR